MFKSLPLAQKRKLLASNFAVLCFPPYGMTSLSAVPSHEVWTSTPSTYQRPKFVSLNTGIRVHYLEWGSGQETIIMLHDVSESSLVWFPLAARIAELGYHVFAPDLRGHGDSSHSCDSNYSTAVMAEDVHAFILDHDLYVAPLALMGAGLGAAVALREAAAYPQLVGALVLAAFDPARPIDSWWPAQAASFKDQEQARALFSCPIWGGSARTLRNMPLALHAMLRPSMPASDGSQLVMKMDPRWLLQHDPQEALAQLQGVECDVLLLAPDGAGGAHGGQETLECAGQARSRTFISVSCASSFVVTEAASQVCKALLTFLDTISGALLPSAGSSLRRPEALGLRPLPIFASLEEARKALQPRRILSAKEIDAELLKAGADANDLDFSNPYQTALAKEPADYFGFIG